MRNFLGFFIILLNCFLFISESAIAQCKGNCSDGYGTYVYDNGDRYTGNWSNGKLHGQGTYTFADGEKYVGEFSNSKRHGYGVYTWLDGSKYAGEWVNGERVENSSSKNQSTNTYNNNQNNNTPTYNNTSGKSYLGWTTKSVNFRRGPGTGYNIIKTLQAGAQIFIISNIASNNYYSIIDIESNTEGFVHKSYVQFGDEVEKSKGEMFTSSGRTGTYNTQIEIFNNTNLTLSLKLNDKYYSFYPKQKKTISFPPGLINYRATASNVLPSIGSKSFEGYTAYTWQFYIQ